MKMRFNFKVVLFLSILIAGFLAGGYISLAKGVPSIAELKEFRPTDGTRVYADDDTLIGEFKVEKGIHISLKNIPKHLINAVIATEDSRFWQHDGIDFIGIGRALISNIRHGRIKEGGSTITQQFAKITFLTPDRTLGRKLREAQLAIKIERELSKEEILELYLNRIYLGHGAHGVEMASRLYFGKSVTQISLPEAAMLAGLIRAPNAFSPYNNLVRAKQRQEVVLLRMEEEGYLKPSERQKARKQPIQFSSLRERRGVYSYFLEYIRQQLEENYGAEMVYKGGLRVYTTMNRKAQMNAHASLQEGLREIDKRMGWRGPIDHVEDVNVENSSGRASFSASIGDISPGVVVSVNAREAVIRARGITGRLLLSNALWASNTINSASGRTRRIQNLKLTDILKRGDVVWVRFSSISGQNVLFSLEQQPEVEGAIVAVDPVTGHIKALVGGYSFTKSEFNRAIYAKRQAGSAIKPVIYAAAIEHGFTAASIVNDEPVSYRWGAGGQWSPENYDGKFFGPTRLRDALAYSRNVVTVKLLDKIGIDQATSIARNVGISSDMPRELSIALGSFSVTPLELTMTYATFANSGVKMNPISIRYIKDSADRILKSSEPEGIEAISPQTSFLITSIMKDAINYGTGRRANIGRPAAGKTGTSNDYRDAWFVGYTPQLVSGVWVGFDDMRRPLGPGEVGGRAAAPIWANFMKNTLADDPALDFIAPEGIVMFLIDPITGLLSADHSAAVYEFFKDGSQPVKYAETPGRIERQIIDINYD